MNMAAEQRTGLLYSVGLHLAIVLLLVFSTQQGPSITPPKGIAIEAEIMDLEEFMKSQNKPKTTTQPKPEPRVEPKAEPPKPDPKPEPKPEPPKPEPKIEPKPIEKPVVKPKVDPVKRNEKTERQKKLEEIRRKRQEAEKQAQQQATQKPEPQTETNTASTVDNSETTPPVGVDNGAEDQRRTLLTLYVASIQAAVTRQWARPSGTPAGLRCQIKVNQIPGGGVIDVSIGTPCNASAVVRNSIINAVKKADPLPFTGFEEVFDRRLNFIFQYQGD